MTAALARPCRWCGSPLTPTCHHCDHICQARACTACGREIEESTSKRKPGDVDP